jgi:hypothetical protein
LLPLQIAGKKWQIMKFSFLRMKPVAGGLERFASMGRYVEYLVGTHFC